MRLRTSTTAVVCVARVGQHGRISVSNGGIGVGASGRCEAARPVLPNEVDSPGILGCLVVKRIREITRQSEYYRISSANVQ